jgi:hypothetical protein
MACGPTEARLPQHSSNPGPTDRPKAQITKLKLVKRQMYAHSQLRLDQIVRAHLQKTTNVLQCLADEDRLRRYVGVREYRKTVPIRSEYCKRGVCATGEGVSSLGIPALLIEMEVVAIV